MEEQKELTEQVQGETKAPVNEPKLVVGIDEFTLVLQPMKRVPVIIWKETAEEMIHEFLQASKIENVFEPMEATNSQLVQGYTSGYQLAERPFYLCLCYNDDNEDMGVCVKFSATAYAMYKKAYAEKYQQTMTLPKLLQMTESEKYSQRLSRIDLTADYFNYQDPIYEGQYLNPDIIYKCLLQSQMKVVDYKGNCNIKTMSGHNKNGLFETIYIGSRKKSNSFLRIYDKRQEQIDNYGFRYEEAVSCELWIRFEAVFRGIYAHQICETLMDNTLIQSDDDLQCFIAGKITDKYIFYNNATDEMLDFSECLLEIASGQAYAPLESPSPRDNELLNSLYYIIMNSGLMITLAKADMVYSDRQASRELMDWLYDMYIEYYYSRAIEGKRPELDKWLKKHEKTVRDYPWEELLEAVETAIENGDNLNKKIKEKEEIEEA